MAVISHAKWHTILRVLTVLCCLDSTNAAGGHAWRWASQGQSCTSGCGGSGSTCKSDIFYKVDSEANFKLVKGGVSCSGYYGGDWSGNPINQGGTCYYPNGGTQTCSASNPSATRLCPCLCVAGKFSESDLATTCTRYDSTASPVVFQNVRSDRLILPFTPFPLTLAPADRPPRTPSTRPLFNCVLDSCPAGHYQNAQGQSSCKE